MDVECAQEWVHASVSRSLVDSAAVNVLLIAMVLRARHCVIEMLLVADMVNAAHKVSASVIMVTTVRAVARTAGRPLLAMGAVLAARLARACVLLD